MSDERYRIGELATLTGLTPDALRFYERQGVLDKPARTSGRFRVYSPLVVDRIRFIKKAQALGFTRTEIRDLVQFIKHCTSGYAREESIAPQFSAFVPL